MPFPRPNPGEKPYNRCIDCEYIGQKCDGPDFLAMDIHRLCEWSRLRKDYLHRRDAKWTNAHIAERADMSLTTVNRFFAGDIEDLKFSTAARILRVLVNGTWGQYPCTMAAGENSIEAIEAECERLREALKEEKARTAYMMERDKFKENQIVVKDKLIAERDELVDKQRRDMHVLAALLGVCVVVIISALVVDLLVPNMGYFWMR